MGKYLEEYLKLKKEKEILKSFLEKKWDKNNFLNFNLSRKDFLYAVMGWCKFLIRPFIEPYTELKIMDYIYINGEEGSYIGRVEKIELFDNLNEAITPTNLISIFPDSTVVNIEKARYLSSIQLYNKKYKLYKKENGVSPKILVICYGLIKDPKLLEV
jgi:hypothetical protein